MIRASSNRQVCTKRFINAPVAPLTVGAPAGGAGRGGHQRWSRFRIRRAAVGAPVSIAAMVDDFTASASASSSTHQKVPASGPG